MKYELTYIISSDENLQGSETLSDALEAFIIKEGGVIITKEKPVAKNLAYPIKKKASGFFALLQFETESEKVKAIEDFVAKEQKIIRHAMLKVYAARPVKPKRKAAGAAQKIEKKNGKDALILNKQDSEQEKSPVELKDIEETLEKILND